MITDMQMPGMDGVCLVQEIRNDHAASELLVIALTSIGTEKPPTDLGIAAVLVKPVKPAILYQTLATVLRGEDDRCIEEPAIHVPLAIASSLKLLVVEDNRLNQKVAQRMLAQLGYTADMAGDGIELLEMIAAKSYDIVLMDIQMPRMDGLTATQEIIKRFAGKKRPLIIGTTAHASQEERTRGQAAGMDDYLIKPIQLVKLKEMLWKMQVKLDELKDA